MKKILMLIVAAAILSGCTSLKTPEINGVVVDSETGKPIPDARVHAEWRRIDAGPGGKGPGYVTKEIWLKADQEGRFTMPSNLVINFIPYPLGQGGYWSFSVYAHEYFRKSYGYESREQIARASDREFKDKYKDGRIIFRLSKISDPDSFDKNFSEIFSAIEKDIDYQLIDLQIFVKQYPDNKRVSGYRLGIGGIHQEKSDYEKALIEYEAVIKEFPNSSAAKEAQEGIKNIKKKQANKHENK